MKKEKIILSGQVYFTEENKLYLQNLERLALIDKIASQKNVVELC